jgi:hypothetical protein
MNPTDESFISWVHLSVGGKKAWNLFLTLAAQWPTPGERSILLQQAPNQAC